MSTPTGPPDPYGQPPYGQPPYGQPQYGQPQYGQPQYGQPQYGQPPYGQPPYGQPPYNPYAGGPYGQQPYGYPPAPPGNPYGYGVFSGPGGAPLAPMGRRFWGLVLDFLIVGVPTAILGIFVGAYKTTTTCTDDGFCTRTHDFSTNWPLDVISLVLGLAYAAYFIGVRTQTIGHLAVGIRVVDARTGAPIGPGRAALRWFVMILGGALCTIGYWSPYFDSQRHQGWHDKSSNSIAVRAP